MRTVVIMIVALAVGFFVGSSQLVKQTKVEPQPSPPPQAVEKAKGLTLPAAAKKLSDGLGISAAFDAKTLWLGEKCFEGQKNRQKIGKKFRGK